MKHNHLTAKQAAGFLGVSHHSFLKHIREGNWVIPYFQYPNSRVKWYSLDDLKDFISKSKVDSERVIITAQERIRRRENDNKLVKQILEKNNFGGQERCM